MKKILLIFSGVVFVSHSSLAEVRLIRAFQWYTINVYANGGMEDFHYSAFGAGIVSTRSPSASAHSVGAVGTASVPVSLSQVGVLNDAGFMFSAALTASAHTGTAGSHGGGLLAHTFDFDVTGQAETLTIEISSVDVTGNATFPDSIGFGYSLGPRGCDSCAPGFGVGSVAGTIVVPLAVGQYRLSLGQMANFAGSAAATNGSVKSTDTVSFTNLTIDPGVLQCNPVLPIPVGGGGGRYYSWEFIHGLTKIWFDPPAINEYRFK